MAKKKQEQKTENASLAQTVANSQRVGYIPADEYSTFKAICEKVRLKPIETKMGAAIKVTVADVKFYTDAQ